MFPIKYIENNLVFNHDGECFAYYELTPYNYSSAYRPEPRRENPCLTDCHGGQPACSTGAFQKRNHRKIERNRL